MGLIVNQGDLWRMQVGDPALVGIDRALTTGQSKDFGYGSYFFMTDLQQEERGPMVDFFSYDKLTYGASALIAGRAIYASPKLTNVQACVIRNPRALKIGESYTGIFVDSPSTNDVFGGPVVERWLKTGNPGSAPKCVLTKTG